MPCAHYPYVVFAVKLGHCCVKLTRKPCLGKNKVYTAKYVKILAYLAGIGSKHCRKLGQNTLYLLSLLRKQLLVFVAKLNNGCRLNKQRGSAAALVMDKSRHLLPVFLLHRYDEPSVPYSYKRLLQILLI